MCGMNKPTVAPITAPAKPRISIISTVISSPPCTWPFPNSIRAGIIKYRSRFFLLDPSLRMRNKTVLSATLICLVCILTNPYQRPINISFLYLYLSTIYGNISVSTLTYPSKIGLPLNATAPSYCSAPQMLVQARHFRLFLWCVFY